MPALRPELVGALTSEEAAHGPPARHTTPRSAAPRPCDLHLPEDRGVVEGSAIARDLARIAAVRSLAWPQLAKRGRAAMVTAESNKVYPSFGPDTGPSGFSHAAFLTMHESSALGRRVLSSPLL